MIIQWRTCSYTTIQGDAFHVKHQQFDYLELPDLVRYKTELIGLEGAFPQLECGVAIVKEGSLVMTCPPLWPWLHAGF